MLFSKYFTDINHWFNNKKVSTDPIFTADHEYIFFQRDSDLTLCCVVQRNAHMLPVFFQYQHTCAYTSPFMGVHHVHAVGSMVEIFAVSEDIAAPWVLSRLLSANRTIPDMTSANQPRVQIHDAVFNWNDFWNENYFRYCWISGKSSCSLKFTCVTLI